MDHSDHHYIWLRIVSIGKHVIFTLIPSHIGIHGNTVVYQEVNI